MEGDYIVPKIYLAGYYLGDSIQKVKVGAFFRRFYSSGFVIQVVLYSGGPVQASAGKDV